MLNVFVNVKDQKCKGVIEKGDQRKKFYFWANNSEKQIKTK